MPKNVSDLKKWDANPRKISASKARILAKTLGEYGDLSGIVFNKELGSLVSGHQRSDVLSAGEITIEKTYAKPTKTGTIATGFITLGDERFSYREVMWDEKRHAAAAIAANRNAGEWDFSAYVNMVGELNTGDFDMELAGFDAVELENILASVSGEILGEAPMPDLPTGDKSEMEQITFTLHASQAEQVRAAMEIAKNMGPFVDTGNENSNGNALARVAETFITQNENFDS